MSNDTKKRKNLVNVFEACLKFGWNIYILWISYDCTSICQVKKWNNGFPDKFLKKCRHAPALRCSLPSIPTCIALKYSCGVALKHSNETKISTASFSHKIFLGEKMGWKTLDTKQIGKKMLWQLLTGGNEARFSSHWIHWVNTRIGIGGNLKAYLGGTAGKNHTRSWGGIFLSWDINQGKLSFYNQNKVKEVFSGRLQKWISKCAIWPYRVL